MKWQEMYPGLCRVEVLGVVCEDIYEYCLGFEKGAKELSFIEADLSNKRLESFQGMKEEWGQGDHCGDCLSIPCSCMACYWAQLIDTGSRIALALCLGKVGYKQPKPNSLASAMLGEEIDDPEYMKCAEKMLAEIDRLEL